MSERHVEIIEAYAARAAHGSTIKHIKGSTFQYHTSSRTLMLHPERDTDYYTRMLPKIIPGLTVTDTNCTPLHLSDGWIGHVTFTWTPEAMASRYKDVLDEFGVADERLGYKECVTASYRKQLTLPGIAPTAEPKRRCRYTQGRSFDARWTTSGLQEIDSGFINRILNPNMKGVAHRDHGGVSHIPFDMWVDDGSQRWLTGSRGDGVEVLTFEIQSSPLDQKVKDNLIHNLRNYQ